MRRPGGLAPLVLTGGVLLVLVLAGRGSAYGEQVFNVNANSTNNTLPLSANESAAQSFTPTTSFVLYNVTVRIQNVGVKSDSVNLTVQTDAGGVPSGTPIAWSVQSQSGSSWLDFPMTPRPQLTRGQTYWIVATNPMSVGNGYGWFHSNTDAVPGEARQNFGGSWLVSTVTDLMYLTYGLAAAPSLAIGMTANRTTADPGATFAYTVYFNNTGSGETQAAWVNLTLAPEVTYVSDDAASIGGTKTSASSWTFGILTNGPRSFRVVVLLAAGASRGAVIGSQAHLDFVDQSGVSGPASTATATLTVGSAPPVVPGEVVFPLALLAVALAAPPIGYELWRRKRSRIEEVFLVHSNGVLLCHLSRRMRAHQDKDDDVLGAMLTVVQNFVRDSFRYEKNRDLDKVEFGSYRVLIERGNHAYIAAAFSGRDSPEIRKKLRKTIREVEGTYRKDLEDFDGQMEPLMGVRDIVSRLIRAS